MEKYNCNVEVGSNVRLQAIIVPLVVVCLCFCFVVVVVLTAAVSSKFLVLWLVKCGKELPFLLGDERLDTVQESQVLVAVLSHRLQAMVRKRCCLNKPSGRNR